MTITLSELLRSVDPKTRERVDGARRRANTPIRNILRDRTRLSFSFDEDGNRQVRQVPVKIEPGKPRDLEEITFDDDAQVLLKLARIRRLLEAGASSWSEYEQINGMLRSSSGLKLDPLDDDIFDKHKDRFEALLQVLDTRDPLQKILHLDRDILGVYSYRTNQYNEEVGEVSLYWGIIGLVSDLLGVNAEDLTIVVFTHELAHAYTHQGFEIDGTQWHSRRFGSADIAVIEGLAQYFTHVCLASKSDAFPDAFAAYEKLRQKQAPCYSAHIDWVTNNTPEQVRRAMLEARRSKERVTVERFAEMLKSAKKALQFA